MPDAAGLCGGELSRTIHTRRQTHAAAALTAVSNQFVNSFSILLPNKLELTETCVGAGDKGRNWFIYFQNDRGEEIVYAKDCNKLSDGG